MLIKDLSHEVIKILFEGGPGSGHWGHKGRPGVRGGSLPGVKDVFAGYYVKREAKILGQRIANQIASEFIKDFDVKVRAMGDEHYLPVTVEFNDKDGNTVGECRVALSKTANEMEIHYMEFSEEYRGKGIGSRLMMNIVDFGLKEGIDKIKLTANGTSGVYSWARMGFDFSVETRINIEKKERIIDSFVGYLDSQYGHKVDRSRFEHSWDIANYKIGDKKVGKEWMLGPGADFYYLAVLDLKGYREWKKEKKG